MRTGLLVMLALFGCQKAVSGPPTMPASEPRGDQCAVIIQVTGMDCEIDCPTEIFLALDPLDGVLEVSVNYFAKRAYVLSEARGCTETALAIMSRAIDGCGFQARILKVTRGS